jgi:hypothetical protein
MRRSHQPTVGEFARVVQDSGIRAAMSTDRQLAAGPQHGLVAGGSGHGGGDTPVRGLMS